MMRCHVCLPDSHVLEIEVDQKATGQQCLDKVCEQLRILEVDYLGLRFCGNKQEQLWLNLRNRLDQQVSGHQPYRFHLRLKFCVQPHSIQQDITRHLYYKQVWQDLKAGQLVLKGQEDRVAKLAALVAQAEFGDQTGNRYQMDIYHDILATLGQGQGHCTTDSLLQAVVEEHQALLDMSGVAAEYRLLQAMAQLPYFGFEFHEVRSAIGDKILFGVGPEGLLLRNMVDNTEENLTYPSIHMATHREREVYLQLIDDCGEQLPPVGYKLVSRKAAVALYRCITEMHSFYRCDTVSNDVSNQFCRDLKGTLVSIFNENSDLGKRYIFDIRRTSREAYDYARRKLYSMSQSTQSLATSQCHGSMQSMDIDRDNNTLSCASPHCMELKERLDSLEDSLLCCICLSRLVATVLCPCGHLTCSVCAQKISECPLCRTEVERRQKMYIPNFPPSPKHTTHPHGQGGGGDEDSVGEML
ncbi:E3 ubiquitin-protein ligase MYLIP-like [Babylonia areolata]|uniref:E3 ubiquitin-protein ligase MYLIP-like n=1 Tax=Babylonia areolata TaxID=304850 RepID=UPI003FD544ED